MNYLKTLKFSKRSDTSVPNTTPNGGIALIDKNHHAVSGIGIYGDVAIPYSKKEEAYTIPDGFIKDIEELYKKYRNN